MTQQINDQEDQATEIILPGPLRLEKVQGTAFQWEYLLQSEDVIVAVNGTSWPKVKSIEDTVKDALERAPRPVLLTIIRDEKIFSVFVAKPIENKTTVLLGEQAGQYQKISPTLPIEKIRMLSNYVIVADSENFADTLEMRKSFLAMIIPPLWLISRRMWGPFVAFTGAILTSFAVNQTLGAAMYLFMCVYIGQRQIPLLLSSMLRNGLNRRMVVAAQNEIEAQTIALQFHGQLRFKFSNNNLLKPQNLDVDIV
ncbi:hypothetical protein OAN307_c29450 [Octadecabacter antarcticus 307]|uniref:PDZ domain-containing protein n=1 Tax=Octadecabacter antarcticus 307 TaxID=391626 RepID=M9RFC5_9RHOB|nr:DUF2628 domain-containing protein [Octadecabacter antarcticus]AGI68495.1 hypothetical protein OAN307_c29450 [Octadecabacter antarcticus 307]